MVEEHVEETEQDEKKLEPTWSQQEVGPCKVKLTIEVAKEKVNEALEAKFKEVNEHVPVPGFRQGHAPRQLLERKFGKGVRDELKLSLISKSFDEAKEAAKLEPVGEPEIDTEVLAVRDGESFKYDIVIEVMPKIEVQGYADLAATKPSVEVDEKEIDDAILHVREERAELAPAPDGKALEGDQVVADFELAFEGKVYDKAENVAIFLNPFIQLYGAKIPEFYKLVAGKKAGDAFEMKLTLAPDHHVKEVAGKEVTLKGALKGVKRKVLPEVDAAFLKSMDMDTVDEFRAEVKKQVRRMKESESDDVVMDQLVEQLLAKNEFVIPEGMAKAAEAQLADRLRTNLLMRGVPQDQIEGSMKDEQDKIRTSGVKSVKAQIILDQIATKERIFITEDAVDERIASMAQRYGKWPHEMRAYLEESGLIGTIRKELRSEEVRKYLLSKSKIEEKK